MPYIRCIIIITIMSNVIRKFREYVENTVHDATKLNFTLSNFPTSFSDCEELGDKPARYMHAVDLFKKFMIELEASNPTKIIKINAQKIDISTFVHIQSGDSKNFDIRATYQDRYKIWNIWNIINYRNLIPYRYHDLDAIGQILLGYRDGGYPKNIIQLAPWQLTEILDSKNDSIFKFDEIINNNISVNISRKTNDWRSEVKKAKNTMPNGIKKFKDRIKAAKKADFRVNTSPDVLSPSRICTIEEHEGIQRWLDRIDDTISNPDNSMMIHYLLINDETIAHSKDGSTWTLNGVDVDITINTFDDLESILDYINPEKLWISNT